MKKRALSLELADERLTNLCGEQLATMLSHGVVIYVTGELGAGKTTFIRGVLRGLGFFGKVVSPSYTLVETYQVQDRVVNHLDLYRIEDPAELDDIGIRDYISVNSIWLIEWPEKGLSHLPPPDITVLLEYVSSGRVIHFTADSVDGKVIIDNCQEKKRFSSFNA